MVQDAKDDDLVFSHAKKNLVRVEAHQPDRREDIVALAISVRPLQKGVQSFDESAIVGSCPLRTILSGTMVVETVEIGFRTCR